MQPLPRRILLAAALITALLLLAFGVVLLHYNSLLTDRIVSAPWRNPIEIYSVPRGADSAPVLRVYGDDWRVSEPLRLRDLPTHVSRAFLAAEDVRFYRHVGVDPIGILRALAADVRGHRVAQGGSTITQQYIKTKLFTNARTLRRKIPELALAVILTARMSKDDVLEGYLNEVYLGQWGGAPVLGLDEAARMYFDKAPGALTADEAALIAGMVRSPNRSNPINGSEEALRRRNIILETMRDEKWITPDDFELSVHRPIRLHQGNLPDTPYGHYLSAMRTELASIDGLKLPRSGAKIYCAMQPAMQVAAEESARKGIAAMRARYPWLRRRSDLQLAILSADPQNGAIRAMVGSSDFRSDSYDRTRRMHRQPGSAIKPFVYAAALASRRFTPSTVLLDEPLEIALDRRRVWRPHDYDNRFRGRVMLRTALEESLNVPAVRIGQSVGLPAVASQLDKFGFDEEFDAVPSLPLGVTELTLRELVAAYAVFPALGEHHKLHMVEEVRDARGHSLYRFKDEVTRACDPAVAWLTNDLLRGVVQRGTASRLVDDGLGFIAGKTGTTSDYRDAWFLGYSSDLVTGLWVGCDDGTPIRLSAGEAAVPLWSRYAQQLRMRTTPIPPPAGITFRDIDPENGGLWARGCEGPLREAYLSGTEPSVNCNGERVSARSAMASLRGDQEPQQISEEQSRSWSDETGDSEPQLDTPQSETAPPGRIPEVRGDDENDGGGSVDGPEDPAASAKQSQGHGKRKAQRRKHRHHGHRGGGRDVGSLLRRIFG